MKQTNFLKSFFLLFALIVGSSSVWAQTYERLTSIANIDEDADYVLGIDGTGFHYSGTSSWGVTALPSAQTPLYYKLKVANDEKSFTAATTINSTKYYLQIPTSNTFSMATSAGTNTDIIIGTTCSNAGTDKGYAVTNKSTTDRHLRRNGTSGIRSYAGNTGSLCFFYKVIPAFTLTAVSNNDNYGTVAVSGNKITATPETGYRVSTSVPYEVTSGTATVVQNNNQFTVTATAACTVRINFEAIPTYTVTFNAEGGTCGTESATETNVGAGVTLPTATTGVTGWEFAGWAADAVDNTTTQPTLYKAGSTYYPTIDTELHAVYTLSETGYAYTRVTSASQIAFAKKIAVASSRSTSRILNHSATTVTAPTETTGEITLLSDQMFALSGDNTTGYVLTGASGTLSQETLSTSGDNDKPIDWSGTNNKWIIEVNTNADNLFALRNAASDKAALEFDGGWQTYYVGTYTSSPYTAMKLYIPKTAYNSKPSAIITPTVAFDSADPVILYLDGTKTNTNTATVTEVSKTINYTSSNTGVATVNSEGVVTAVGIGTTTITASVDAELGVSAPAYDTYEVTVKSATTISGLKTIDSTSGKAFTADLTDAVVAYVSGDYAYIQDASAAILVNKSGHGLVKGKKINGAVSGTVKITNSIDQLTDIDLSAATVTEDGVIPAALTKTVAEVSTNAAALDGQLVTINAVTIDKPSTTTTLRDGSKIGEEEATITMYSPNGVASVTNKEKGNFTGYISFYNGNTPRINLYEQNQFTKTHNVPQNQDMAFATGSYTFDEGTDAVTGFAGQEVTKTTVKGAVTYSIKDGSDGIITSLNSSTGAVVLNGARGTATIVATAAYAEVDEGDGYLTPYKELSKEYSVTVRPLYTVTFSVNGTETELCEESFGAGVTVPANPAAIGEYTFQGWSSTTVATTDTKPTLASLTAGNNYKPSSGDDETYYAVFALRAQTGTDHVLDQSYSYGDGKMTVGGTYTDQSTASPPYYLLHNGGYVESEEFDLSIISKVVVYGGYYGGSNYRSITIGDGTNTWKSVSVNNNNNQAGTNTYTDGTALSGTGKLRITSTCGGTTNGVRVSGFKIYKLGPVYGYTRYTTSLSESVDIIIPESGYLSYCYENTLDFSSTDVKAYKAKIEEAKVVLTKVDIVPAKTGVVLYCETPATYTVPVATTDDVVTDNEMVGVLDRTQVVWNPSEGVYNYILQQGQFNMATDGYLKPNRAYLSTSYDVTALGAKALSVVFAEDETDGIRSIENSRIENSDYYNLSGQRVGKDYKGIVIVNGKKYMRK